MNQGNLRDLGLLWTNLTTNPAELAGLFTDDYRNAFEKRLGSEGINFLTTILPALGKDVDRALIGGEPFNITARFGKHENSELPSFLYNLFSKVFNDDGTLRSNVSPRHIKWIRQLTLMYYKLEVEYEEGVLKSFVTDFRTRDCALNSPLYYVGLSSTLHETSAILERAAHRLYGVLRRKEDAPDKLVPRHGPGATACHSQPWEKYHKAPRFIPRLHQVFDYSETFFLSATHLADELDKLIGADELHEPVSVLTAVPKDSRGPRLICMEPREMQYVQQGLMRELYRIVEKSPSTRGRVNFTDQGVNQDLAKRGSIDKSYATLDLKDASDRVRWDLVQILFPSKWVRALNACRTRFVKLPDGSIFGPLEKFAPMGSAVCFPVEALTFWALISGNVTKDVYVYGDDIILPTACVEQAIAVLESVDLKVNTEKSCYKTNFRESCGGEFFRGTDVGYVKVRKWIDNTLSSHLSFVGFVNEIIEGYGETCAAALMRYGDDRFGPHVRSLSGVALSYQTNLKACNDVFFKRRWNKHWQKYEYKIPMISNHIHKIRDWKRPNSHWCEMLRKFLTRDIDFREGEYADGTCTVKESWRGDL